MFQESDERTHPVLVIDSHHQSPIITLYVAYGSARRPSSKNKDTGGHLISLSLDGTLALTNLNSSEIHRALHNFPSASCPDSYRHRADSYF